MKCDKTLQWGHLAYIHKGVQGQLELCYNIKENIVKRNVKVRKSDFFVRLDND